MASWCRPVSVVLRKLLRLCLGPEEKSDGITPGCLPGAVRERWHVHAGIHYLWSDETFWQIPPRAQCPVDGTHCNWGEPSLVVLTRMPADSRWPHQLSPQWTDTTKAHGSVA